MALFVYAAGSGSDYCLFSASATCSTCWVVVARFAMKRVGYVLPGCCRLLLVGAVFGKVLVWGRGRKGVGCFVNCSAVTLPVCTSVLIENHGGRKSYLVAFLAGNPGGTLSDGAGPGAVLGAGVAMAGVKAGTLRGVAVALVDPATLKGELVSKAGGGRRFVNTIAS
jgi:hypothetical protein